jgi:hypothetical protein
VQKAWVPELLFGGAAGGGKTAYLLGDFAQDVPTDAGPFWHGVLFRKTYPQLEEVIKQSLEMYPLWFGKDNVKWTERNKTWTWKNGATLKMRFAELETDWMEYQGHQYGWIGWDELTTWPTPTNYLRMKARLRSAHPEVKYLRIRATANPGGPGHEWVKEYFSINSFPRGGIPLTPEDESGMTRMFIPSRIQDNKILLAADPAYIGRLKSLGSPELVRAWLEGDWTVVQGAYFPEFGPKHITSPCVIPESWARLCGMDWGSAAPFAVYWAAVSDGCPLPDGRAFPRGSLVVYREWYGTKGTNIGLKMDAEQVARGIAERQQWEKINDFVIDPAAFAMNGGPSIAERMMRGSGHKLSMRRADNKRIPGWDQLRNRLRGNEDGLPMIYFFSTCHHAIRTLPSLQHDLNNAEDVDTDGEDHAGDALRYLCMARPWVRDPPKAYAPRAAGYCLDELWRQRDEDYR